MHMVNRNGCTPVPGSDEITTGGNAMGVVIDVNNGLGVFGIGMLRCCE